ncbi:MAG TPA: PIG-L family deacetylase [Trinickia sp.]|uniref:PIG-L deacetylase family protein n=1 Tax=Trinickia sp. TaxID=2571163 RepID=UPI002C71DCC9|nr:PIG-L family deacetylase [Trinickia sp.]HVW53537.1 PIG-L family deacetylase [Trinickia sp.]
MRTRPSSLRQDAAPCLVISPHLDDAVFSCGMLLASRPGTVVCTVFCGEPTPPMHTPWDSSAGHRDSSEAMRARIAEDERALAILDARAIRLPFLDSQYGGTPSAQEIASGLADVWLHLGTPPLVAPLGLHHSDHVLVGEACAMLAQRQRMPALIAYEDAPYRAMRGVSKLRYEMLAARGWRVEQTVRLGDGEPSSPRAGAANAKWRAVHAYRSQLRAFADPHPHDLTEPERYARLVPRWARR